MKMLIDVVLSVLFFTQTASAQNDYPRNYFRSPLNIPMQLVANFGEIRANHWHMGLDIRTQHKVNLPVYAAADGYIARVSVEPGGFGQAIYINHPNGYTSLYGHLNSFFPALAEYVKQQQYAEGSWRINLTIPPGMFPVQKGSLIALSGSTGASEGPHVHFEIRDTKTENCLNPLLFGFPIPDAVPPTISRLAMYDRNKSSYDQSPQFLALKRSGSEYTVPGLVRVGSDKISFAIGAVDHFTATPNPNGIYSAKIFVDGKNISGFELTDISYNDTRYINAQLDYPYKSRGGVSLQNISPLPGATNVVYNISNGDGLIHLGDNAIHNVLIEVRDANMNLSKIRFIVRYDKSVARSYAAATGERFVPNNLNVFERDNFELYTTEKTIYDTVNVNFSVSQTVPAGAISSLFSFVGGSIPVHDSITVRIKPTIAPQSTDKIIIKNISGSKIFVARADQQKDWLSARFRQFGIYQVFIDNEPPTVNAPSTNLTKASRIVFTPKDNFNSIRNFRAEVDGQWLRFTNDKGRTWIYTFDEKFPRGQHELKVTIEDEAGNVATRSWTVVR